MEQYPSRVALYEDGVYRWSYDMDMWHNRFLLGLIVKLISVLLGIPTLFVGAMVLKQLIPLLNEGLARDRIMFFIRNDLIILYVVGGMWIGSILLTLIVYAICAAVMKGTWRLCFEMDDSAVALVQSDAARKRNDTLATVAQVAEIAAMFTGKSDISLRNARNALHASSEAGYSSFDSVRRATPHPEHDLINLRQFLSMNQIYVNKEDFPFVRDFILERVREKARP